MSGINKASAARWARPGAREAARERARKMWADPAYRAKNLERHSSEEARSKMSVACAASWADQKIRAQRAAAISAGQRARCANPAVHAETVARLERGRADPQARAKAAAAASVAHAMRRAQKAKCQGDQPRQIKRKAKATVIAALPMDPFERRLFGVAIPQTRAAACEERSESARDAVQAVG